MYMGTFVFIGLLLLSTSKSAASNTISNHVVNLPKFLSPSALAKICHLSNGIIKDDENHSGRQEPKHTLHAVEAEYPVCDVIDHFQNGAKSAQAVTPSKSTFSSFKIILAGAPASGKGTQCEVIKANFGLVHLSTGDILRSAVRQKSALGLMAKPFMDGGHLVPDDLIIELILNRLRDHDCETRGWLLDGFPRTKPQAEALKKSGIIPDIFLLLDVPEDILLERVTGRRTDPATGKIYHMKYSPPENDEVASRLVQRSDDTAEKITIRYKEFQSHIDDIQSCYIDRMVRIDGTSDQGEVSKTVISELDIAILSKRKGMSKGVNADMTTTMLERVPSFLNAETIPTGELVSY